MRVAEYIREEIAGLLHKDVKDPRIGFVSILEVEVSPDLRYANVYVSILGDEQQRKSSLIGLRQCAGWVRRELGRRLRLRFSPEVRFFEDKRLDRAFRLEEMFRELHSTEEAGPEPE